MSDKERRFELSRYARRIMADGLVTAGGGNISARAGDVMLISPSGYALADIEPEQWTAVSIATGLVGPSSLRPSSEVLMHLGCYRRRSDVAAVVHTHPPHTVALVSAGHDLKPMFADCVVYLGREIPHIDYITVTTPQLASAVELVIGTANAVVLRNHGAITLGQNLKEAYFRTATVEEAARIQLLALQVGEPRFLSPSEIEDLDRLGSEQYRRELLTRMHR